MIYCAAFGGLGPATVLNILAANAVGAALTHGLRHRMRARGWLELPVGRLLPRLAAAAVALALGLELIAFLIGLPVKPIRPEWSFPVLFLLNAIQWLMPMSAWVALYTAICYFRRWRSAEIARLQLEVAARQAQLDALRAQLNPHFLFNALNSLRALIAERPAQARELVTDLSELLRYTLLAGHRERVPLAEELTAVESYLQLESVRLEERLRWRVEAAADTRSLALPPMLLQGLVENAVKHGISAQPQGGEVAVAARRAGARLELTVSNSGRLAPTAPGGFGLANARQRLRLLYGTRAALELGAARPDLVEARVVLPAEPV